MQSPYPDFRKIETHRAFATSDFQRPDTLVSVARGLLSARPHQSRLSPLVFMTDPQRVPDLMSAVEQLPAGSAVIYRHFGEDNRTEIAEQLRVLTRDCKHQFLIGADPELAVAVGADGVHFKRDTRVKAPNLWRERRPDWVISMAGIKGDYLSYLGDLSCLDGLFLSPVFDSRSPSAGAALGPSRFADLCLRLKVPVFALGGVTSATVTQLLGSSAAGFAAIDGLSR